MLFYYHLNLLLPIHSQLSKDCAKEQVGSLGELPTFFSCLTLTNDVLQKVTPIKKIFFPKIRKNSLI